MSVMENIKSEFKTRNFSIYGQWTGILCVILCIAVGIANIFTFNAGIIIFSIICLVTGLLIIFLEVPLLLRICPTSSKFDEFIRKFHSNWGRAAFYLIASTVQWLSLVTKRGTSLIAAAVFLLFAGLFYLLAAVKKQEFMGSKTLGGGGIAQMIV
ncbi:hypothetical protein EX30DRAFT_340696 [Ascodesmis nigricans]|uniref:Golgi apparatus membrane protein TVP18 n=1 Tax=Ascodesmis nigricans TaxID=341454 RepID=A0A4V3SIU7_9PEZI|nr:hypothetical protein EX30DRAFT_340696 [Ascodesmis nigricans]